MTEEGASTIYTGGEGGASCPVVPRELEKGLEYELQRSDMHAVAGLTITLGFRDLLQQRSGIKIGFQVKALDAQTFE